jgi:spermidine/putrescine-binding protein
VLQHLNGGTRADVVECSLDQVPWLVKQGYIQALDPARLPQWDRVPAALRDFPGLSIDGVAYAAPLDSADVGIIYRTDRVESVPTSFRDVFASRFRGRGAMENDATMGLRLGAAAIGGTDIRELSTRDLEQAVRFLKSKDQRLLKHFKDSYELEGLFLLDEIDIAAGDRATARKLAEAGAPVAFAVPEEGLLVRGRGLAIAADCSDLDAAYAFIEHSLEAASAAAGASPQQAVAAGSILVTPPASWDEWRLAWEEVVPATGFG